MGKMKFGEKAKNPKATFLRLMKDVFEGRYALILLIVFCIILSAFATTYSASFIGSFIDDVVIPLKGVDNPDFTKAIQYLCKFALVVAVSIAASFACSYIMVGVAQKAIFDMRIKMFDKLESLPLSYFDKNARGSIMSRFANDTDTLNQLVANGLVQLLTAAMTLVMVLVSMALNSWILLLVVIAFIFITLYVTGLIGKKSGAYFKAQQKAVGDVNGYIEEMMNGQRVVKVFTHEEKCKEEFEVLNKDLEKCMAKANTWAGSMGPVNNNLGHLQYVVLVLAGAVAIIARPDIYTIGALAAFLQLSKSFSNNISQISQQANNVLLALAGAERIYKLLDETGEMDDGDVTLVRVKGEGEAMEECKERTGRWAWKVPEKDKTVLHDISLYAKPGQKIAFVGSTGAGKTTITNLLNRFYNIQKGTITIDGVDIRRIKLNDLRRSMAMVLQDTNLFTGTVRENIRYGNPQASDDDVIKAAKLANAHEFIMMMKDGYDTVITNNGENLSQGQRQLLSIARAAIADPPIMVLDEATSSIDTHTETLVQSGMDKLMENRTVFVIAHRLSTVRNSNAMMVLENGRIIERGDHEDLLKEKGVYYSLYTGKTELS